MNDVTATLYDSQGNIVATAVTNSSGIYEFTGIPDGVYTVMFSSTAQPGGVNLTDAFLVMLRLLNVITFTPFQNMLADVNSSGSVTWSDYFEIVISYLNQGIPFSGGPWDFEPITITVSGGNRTGLVTAGGSNGDVNGTFQPPKFGNCILDQLASNITASETEQTTVGLAAQEAFEVAGMHLIFIVPEGIMIESVDPAFPDAHVSRNENEIRVTWMSTGEENLALQPHRSFVEFKVSALENTSPGQIYQLTLGSESHFIGTEGEMLPLVNLTIPGLIFRESNIEFTENIYPNPFLSVLTLDYSLPADGNVRIIVTNAAGQIISIVANGFQEAGSHSVKIDGSTWTTGIYHYGIFLTGEKTITASGTMIKSR
jgi:hypothetical protein